MKSQTTTKTVKTGEKLSTKAITNTSAMLKVPVRCQGTPSKLWYLG